MDAHFEQRARTWVHLTSGAQRCAKAGGYEYDNNLCYNVNIMNVAHVAEVEELAQLILHK